MKKSSVKSASIVCQLVKECILLRSDDAIKLKPVEIEFIELNAVAPEDCLFDLGFVDKDNLSKLCDYINERLGRVEKVKVRLARFFKKKSRVIRSVQVNDLIKYIQNIKQVVPPLETYTVLSGKVFEDGYLTI